MEPNDYTTSESAEHRTIDGDTETRTLDEVTADALATLDAPLTNREKRFALELLIEIAESIRSVKQLADKISPQQIETVQKLQSNPLFSKVMGGLFQ